MRPRFLIALLLLSPVQAFLSANLAQGQTRYGSFDYSVVAIPHTTQAGFPNSVHLCTGESVEITVSIRKLIYGNGPTPIANLVGGGEVFGEIEDWDVVRWEDMPDEADPFFGGMPLEVIGEPHPSADYRVVAVAPGQTTIEFSLSSSVDDEKGLPPADSAVISIEVTNCYEAYTSGLATIFVKKLMGDFSNHFVLTGYTPLTGGVTTTTQAFFFLPNQDRQGGSYVLVDQATILQRSHCLLVASGRYEVKWYIPEDQPVPPGTEVGDLLLFWWSVIFL